MHADKLVPAVIAAVAVACLLFAGRAHGQDGYVPAAASKQVEEPLATKPNGRYLPQPEVMPVPTHLLKKPGFGLTTTPQGATRLTTLAGGAATLDGALSGGYLPTPTTEPEPEPEPAAETATEPQPEPAAETTTEPQPEPAAETTTEPAPETPTEQEPTVEATTEPEPVTPTAPGQGDFYRTGETPTAPEPPATPTAPATDETPSSPATDETPSAPATDEPPSAPATDENSYSGGGGGDSKQVDDDGEPVDGLSPKAIANILKEHNLFRAKEGEKPLTWNATVAKYAQQYAEQRKGDCALKHSTGPYGENLMYGDGKKWTWRHTVDEWSDEKKNYHYSTNTCDPGKQCGHYTAVVWKDTTAVGCGRVTCTTGNTLMVCSYYPPGNYDGEKPY